jgi:hypothetical protein
MWVEAMLAMAHFLSMGGSRRVGGEKWAAKCSAVAASLAEGETGPKVSVLAETQEDLVAQVREYSTNSTRRAPSTGLACPADLLAHPLEGVPDEVDVLDHDLDPAESLLVGDLG